MFSRQTAQDALTLMFTDDVIDEVEFVMLYEVNKKNPSFPYWSYDRFDLTGFADEESKAEFRLVWKVCEFFYEDLRIHAHLSDLIPRFVRSVPELSEIISEVSSHIIDNYGYLLQSLNQHWLQPYCLQSFADAISGRGYAFFNCWGFIDDTA